MEAIFSKKTNCHGTLLVEHQSVDFQKLSKKRLWNGSQLFWPILSVPSDGQKVVGESSQ